MAIGNYKTSTYDRLHEFLGASGDVEDRVHELKAGRDSLAARVKELEETVAMANRTRDLHVNRASNAADQWMQLYESLKNPLAQILGTEHIETIVEKVKSLVAESPSNDAKNWRRLYQQLVELGLEPDLGKDEYEEVDDFIAKQINELNDSVDKLQAENDNLREELESPDERPSTQTVYNFITQIHLN